LARKMSGELTKLIVGVPASHAIHQLSTKRGV
jgi:hypothetical protein